MSDQEREITFPKEDELRQRLNAHEPVVIVPLQPRLDGKPDHCFPTVQRQVTEHGGVVLCGWKITEVKDLYIEAVFHAVWRSPDGELLDVTRNDAGSSHSTFIPVSGALMPTTRMEPVQVMILEHPKMSEFLSVQAELRALKNERLGGRMSGMVHLTPKMESLEARSGSLARELVKIREERAKNG